MHNRLRLNQKKLMRFFFFGRGVIIISFRDNRA